LAYQPPTNNTFHSEQTSHWQSASSTFLPKQTNTSHQLPAKGTGRAVRRERESINPSKADGRNQIPYNYTMMQSKERFENNSPCRLVFLALIVSFGFWLPLRSKEERSYGVTALASRLD
jgi:hypothetical protein